MSPLWGTSRSAKSQTQHKCASSLMQSFLYVNRYKHAGHCRAPGCPLRSSPIVPARERESAFKALRAFKAASPSDVPLAPSIPSSMAFTTPCKTRAVTRDAALFRGFLKHARSTFAVRHKSHRIRAHLIPLLCPPLPATLLVAGNAVCLTSWL